MNAAPSQSQGVQHPPAQLHGASAIGQQPAATATASAHSSANEAQIFSQIHHLQSSTDTDRERDKSSQR
jgi:hypothetical protein